MISDADSLTLQFEKLDSGKSMFNPGVGPLLCGDCSESKKGKKIRRFNGAAFVTKYINRKGIQHFLKRNIVLFFFVW